MSRRALIGVLISSLAALAAVSFASSATFTPPQTAGRTAKDDTIIFDSWGGWFEDQQTKYVFNPFARKFGVKLKTLSDGDQQFAKVAVQAKAGTGSIDVVHAEVSWVGRGARRGLWAPIDYSIVKKTNLFPDVTDKHGVAILYWTFNIIYNRKVFATTHPRTWAQVWAYARAHPGHVAMWGAEPNYNIEAALMASGIPKTKLYPLTPAKIKRAYTWLDKIKTKVKWWNTGAEAQKLFADNEVDVGAYYSGDAYGQIDKGVPLGVVWNQGLYTKDYWVVPKNAPHRKLAMQFINWASQSAKAQARFDQAVGYGPVNRIAFRYLSPKFRARMPSLPAHKAVQVNYDYRWWGAHGDRMSKQWNTWIHG